MLFKSKMAPKTWDCMAYYHEGVYYLYYLISERFACDGFAVATSTDGVHWEDQGWAVRPSDQMVRYLGTGSVWKDPAFEGTGRFQCNYSEWRMEGGRNVQQIFFAESEDLLHWRKLGDGQRFAIDERYYKRVEPEARGPWEDPRWDGMSAVPCPEGGYYGYWTAMPREFLGFGFGRSEDGVKWEALEPPRIEWGDTPQNYFIEVGGVHELDGRYYAMLADYASVNCGMFSFVADSPGGPFRPARRNFGLMRNRSKMHAYFTRFCDTPDGVLINHHSLAEGQFSDEHYSVYYAPLKKARLIEGDLYFAWWEGNEKLKEHPLEPDPQGEEIEFDRRGGLVLEGRLDLPGGLNVQDGQGAGVGIWANEGGIVEIGPVAVDGRGLRVEESVDREVDFGAEPRFRLLLHRNMLEFYLEDLFIQCYTMDCQPNGRLTCRGARDLRGWQWGVGEADGRIREEDDRG